MASRKATMSSIQIRRVGKRLLVSLKSVECEFGSAILQLTCELASARLESLLPDLVDVAELCHFNFSELVSFVADPTRSDAQVELGLRLLRIGRPTGSTRVSLQIVAARTRSIHLRRSALNTLIIGNARVPASTLGALIDLESGEFLVDLLFACRFFPSRALVGQLMGIALSETMEVEARTAALEAIGDIGSGSIRELSQLLDHQVPAIRYWTCVALGWLNGKSAKSAIMRLLDDNSPASEFGTVSDAAAQALATMASR